MAKNIKQAAAYAKPHTMSGKSVKAETGYKTDPNSMSATESTPGGMPARRVSMGNPASEQINGNGEVKMRGAGAATKGVMSRGPMA